MTLVKLLSRDVPYRRWKSWACNVDMIENKIRVNAMVGEEKGEHFILLPIIVEKKRS